MPGPQNWVLQHPLTEANVQSLRDPSEMKSSGLFCRLALPVYVNADLEQTPSDHFEM